MHVGNGSTASKTEAMFFPRPREPYEHGNTERFSVSGDDNSTVGYVDFTKEPKYLGSLIAPTLKS